MILEEKTADLPPLVERARSGDVAAQDALIRRYQARIAGFLLALTSQPHQVEDLSQTVFLKMVMKLPQLREAERFEAWLFRLARHAALDHFRREKWRQFFVPFVQEHEELPSAWKGLSPMDDFLEALQSLPPAQRELIVLLQEREWSYEELASITQSTVSSVKSRLFRARTELKHLLSHE